ncbi:MULTISPECIES: chromosomal replication initiator protein DnaA [Persicobacter]|uniref:Chromosomal replication initiator protein DnaA n=1 Tax=Persicobacter diffluens TaxID=981 RepID=A0AAN4W093_9BACT|nr:chromosomal replication initiator protein DnaA [Persicobacter sp. CCB-QB2]GJM61937.1 chromosomal replication initiator protein DnaA [Persicobacter diffluens]
MNLDAQTVWQRCLDFVKSNISEQAFNTWFSPIVPLRLSGTVLTIQVPSQYFYEYLEEHFVYLLRAAIDKEIGKSGRLEYSVIVDRGNENTQPYTVNLPNGGGSSSKPSTTRGEDKDSGYTSPFDIQAIDKTFKNSNLNPNYTFENYIEGDCNRLARSAGFAVAQKPGITSFNPLMLYGGVGLGKTHLVQAVGNEILRKDDYNGKFVLYVSSEKFTNQFIEALKANQMREFQNFYLQVDVLIIDDVQFLSGKEKTQEMFFHIFNHLHQSGKQIIMTSDCPPRELKGLQERLLSRFKWGLTADLQTPDFETRIAIIQKKMQADGINIPDEVLEYLAHTIDTNIRELEGVLISLIAHASLVRQEIDVPLAKQILKNIVHDIETEVGIDFIQKTVAEYFSLKVDDLKAKTRKKEIVVARQIAMYFSKEYTNHSLKSIGYHFGGRDHSTVIHAVQSVNDMLEKDHDLKTKIAEVDKQLKMTAR